VYDYKHKHQKLAPKKRHESDAEDSEEGMEQIQQMSEQCTADLCTTQAQLEGLRAKITAPVE